MNWNSIREKYYLLNAEERFRLLLAAESRDDQSEVIALEESAGNTRYVVPSHVPYLEAFEGIALALFVELVEDAALFHDCWEFYSERCEMDSWEQERQDQQDQDFDLDLGFEDEDETEDDDGTEDEDEVGSEAESDDELEEDESDDEDTATEEEAKINSEGYLGLTREEVIAKASAYLFIAKYRGWAAFCEKLGIPPHHPWRDYPGCKRLIQSIEIGERWAFTEEEMLGWLQHHGSENAKVGLRAEQITKTLINALKKGTEHCPK
jgi:hypothetical protein